MKKVKMIMIDAFKLDYLKYAPYLNSLTKKYQWGELEMPPGHWGGEEIIFHEKSTKLALFQRTNQSSLKFVKYFSWLDRFGSLGRFVIDSMINLIRLIKGHELFRTGKIPLKRLSEFDFCTRKPLWKIQGVDKKYFGILDKVGHEYGTKSKEIIHAIRKLDRKISKMGADIIFSDHGMADITKMISVPITKDCFIDSDMARYWGSENELKEVREKLPMKYGKILDWPDKSYGELIFLTKTGTLILPNFWQGRDKVKAMHGYDGKHKDMKAFYILNKKGKKKNLRAEDLHKILIEMLKNENQDFQ
jgi:hypothetical protein